MCKITLLILSPIWSHSLENIFELHIAITMSAFHLICQSELLSTDPQLVQRISVNVNPHTHATRHGSIYLWEISGNNLPFEKELEIQFSWICLDHIEYFLPLSIMQSLNMIYFNWWCIFSEINTLTSESAAKKSNKMKTCSFLTPLLLASHLPFCTLNLSSYSSVTCTDSCSGDAPDQRWI